MEINNETIAEIPFLPSSMLKKMLKSKKRSLSTSIYSQFNIDLRETASMRILKYPIKLFSRLYEPFRTND